MRRSKAFLPLVIFYAAVLHASEQVVPQVVITAARTVETTDETLASVSVLTREDIERIQARSVPDLLRGIPGVQISTSGGLGKAASVFLRGANEDQVLVLIDGIKTGSATLGTTAFENLPLDEIERIEVVRGPRSSLYGSEAIGGVIQIFTRRGRGPIRPHASVGAGSFHTRRAAAGVSGGDGGFSFSFSASHVNSAGFDVRDSAASEGDADGYENNAVSFRAARSFGARFEAEVHFLRSDGFTEFDGGFVNESDLLNQIVGVKASFEPAGFWHAELHAGRSTDKQMNFKDGVQQTRFETHRDSLSLLNDVSLPGANLLTLGLDLDRDRIDGTTAFNETERTNAGAFARLSTRIAGQDLLFAARHDDNEQFGEVTTGSAAWGWSPTTDIRLRASYGTAFRAPTFNQLFFPGFGNPTLDPERSRSAELGASAGTPFGALTLSVFRTEVEDLIIFDPVTFFPENVSRARILGVEIGYSIQRSKWRLEAALGFLDPENRSAGSNRGNVLPRRSQRTFSFEVHRERGKLRLGTRLVAEGRRFDDIANQQRLGGYASVDLLARYEIHPEWLLYARLENLFDRSYQTAASFDQPGRGVFFTLRFKPRTN